MAANTIFISAFSHSPIGNFSVPGGVFELLAEHKKPDTQVILLVTKDEHYEKIREASYIKNGAITVHQVPLYEPKRLAVKIFRFFYAYLIFTGTTKTLATLGARADMPPAGGNRHLAFVKSAIANTIGKIPAVKKQLVPWLFDRIFNERPYAHLFEKYQPDLVFAANMAMVPDSELLAEAKRRGVKTLGMVCNWDHLNKYFIPRQADYLIAQNEPMRREAVEFQGYEPEQITVTGFPKFDIYPTIAKYTMNREEFLRHFNIPQNAKLILFISGSAYSLDEGDILETISNWIKEGNLDKNAHLLIRPYVTLRDRKQEEAKYKKLMTDPTIAFNWMKGDESGKPRELYLGMLAHADVVISMFSTTAIEAALLDKPTIAIGFDGYAKRPPHQSIRRMETMHHFKNVLDTGNVPVARNFDELKSMIESYLATPSKDRDKRMDIVRKLCHGGDGLASNRVTEIILSHAAA
ncbi:MAG: CDP-glycerol glycerophosphotransferase family protein [Patescibacteria group bacterium]